MAAAAALPVAAAAAPSLLDLDQHILVLVAEHLTWRELLQFETVCRRCADVAREPALWRRLLRLEFDLAYRAPPSHWRAAFRAARAAAAHDAPLALAGAYTDGGCDGDARYSVDALFSPAPWEAYCSAAGRNVHCLGILRAGAAGGDPAEAARRALLIERCSVAATLLFGAAARRGPGRSAPGQPGFAPEGDLARWSKPELEALFLQLFDMAQGAHPLGALLFAGLTPAKRAQEAARCVALAAELRAARAAAAAAPAPGAAQQPPDAADDGADEASERTGQHAASLRMFSPPPAAEPGAPRLQASVASLRISRVGQFSCPVQSGAVLLGAAPRGGDPRSAAARAALVSRVEDSPFVRALDDATTLEAVQDASEAGALPRITHLGASPAGVWAEFEPRGCASAFAPHAPPGALWPVLWFAFTPRAEAAARAAAEDAAIAAQIGAMAAEEEAPQLPDEDRFDVLEVPLAARHGGDMACVKLIGSENLMEQWGDDHAEPNIDIATVELCGFAVQLPAEEDA